MIGRNALVCGQFFAIMFKRLAVILYTGWVVLVFFFFMLVLLPFILLPFLAGIRFTFIAYRALWLWAWLFSLFTGIRYRLVGREHIPANRALIYVSNHTSFLDVPGLRLLIPGEFRPIAKKELLRIPVFGFIVKAATVVVDRSNAESRKNSLAAARNIISRGISMLIFAEGTQNRTDKLLQPFKDGAFKLAIETQTPIVPVVITGAAQLMPPGQIWMKPGLIEVTAGKPIEVSGLTPDDMEALKQQTFEVMMNMLTRRQG